MRFSEIKRFAGGGIGEVTAYLAVLGSGLRDLFTGLYQLDLVDNFQSFSWTGSVAAGAEVGIPNGLKTIPRYWIIVDSTTGMPLARGTTPWSLKLLYIRNMAMTSSVTVTLIFFR